MRANTGAFAGSRERHAGAGRQPETALARQPTSGGDNWRIGVSAIRTCKGFQVTMHDYIRDHAWLHSLYMIYMYIDTWRPAHAWIHIARSPPHLAATHHGIWIPKLLSQAHRFTYVTRPRESQEGKGASGSAEEARKYNLEKWKNWQRCDLHTEFRNSHWRACVSMYICWFQKIHRCHKCDLPVRADWHACVCMCACAHTQNKRTRTRTNMYVSWNVGLKIWWTCRCPKCDLPVRADWRAELILINIHAHGAELILINRAELILINIHAHGDPRLNIN